GGGISSIGTLNLTNSCICFNSALGGTSGAAFGGGLFTGNYGAATLDSCTIASNAAVGHSIFIGAGAGILNDLGTLTLIRCTVSGNYASPGPGSGVDNEDLAIIENSTISGNIVNGGAWGAIFTGPYAATGLDSSTVTAN